MSQSVFNPSLCRLSPFHRVLSGCFKAMLLTIVGILLTEPLKTRTQMHFMALLISLSKEQSTGLTYKISMKSIVTSTLLFNTFVDLNLK